METAKKVSAADIATRRALRGYSVYTFTITQTGENAPVVTVLENTLTGVPVWTVGSDGLYEGTLAGAFTEGKTVCCVLQQNTTNNTSDIVRSYRASANAVHVLSLTDPETPANDLLTGTVIEVRVYP